MPSGDHQGGCFVPRGPRPGTIDFRNYDLLPRNAGGPLGRRSQSSAPIAATHRGVPGQGGGIRVGVIPPHFNPGLCLDDVMAITTRRYAASAQLTGTPATACAALRAGRRPCRQRSFQLGSAWRAIARRRRVTGAARVPPRGPGELERILCRCALHLGVFNQNLKSTSMACLSLLSP